MLPVGEGDGGKIWENGIETCKISCMKRVASPGSMHNTGLWWWLEGMGEGRRYSTYFSPEAGARGCKVAQGPGLPTLNRLKDGGRAVASPPEGGGEGNREWRCSP